MKLVQGIFENYTDHSFFILRNRIYTTGKINAFTQGLVKIAAKRVSYRKNIGKILNRILTDISRGSVLHDYNRRIATVVVDRHGEIVAASTNQNYKNKTLHSEVMVIGKLMKQGHTKADLGWKIYCSLKPCKMCAGLIADFFQYPNTIFELTHDKGNRRKQ